MTTSLKLKITLSSFWHAGTGRGSGAGADAVVAKDTDGLPHLPGSHMRGLMRHALRLYQDLGQVRHPTCLADELFGLGTEGASPKPAATRFETKSGVLEVGDARLPEELIKALAHEERKELRSELFMPLSSTKLEDGVVAHRTLRTIEMAVPLTLYARITAKRALSDAEFFPFEASLGLIRAVGKHRTRGLGRARVVVEERS